MGSGRISDPSLHHAEIDAGNLKTTNFNVEAEGEGMATSNEPTSVLRITVSVRRVAHLRLIKAQFSIN